MEPFSAVEEFTALMKKAGNRCELIGYEDADHSFFNEGKYFALTMAEAGCFSSGWAG